MVPSGLSPSIARQAASMTQRQCPECSSELVLTRRPEGQSEPVMAPSPSTYWRCSVCGRGFTAEQIRQDKRAKSASKPRS
jgi:uncharacterized protein with PIN domain